MRSKRRRVRKGAAFLFTFAVCLLVAVIVLLTFKNRQKLQAASTATSNKGASSASALAKAASSSAKAALLNDTKTGGILELVNKQHKLSKSFSPNLVTVPSKYYYNSYDSRKFDKRAAPYLIKFLNAGDKAGYNLTIYSGYRTYEYQQSNFDRHVKQYEANGKTYAQAVALTANLVAPPGKSEHETGLAADIVSKEYAQQAANSGGLEATVFDKTAAYRWLYGNCAKYGFILRYLKNKTKVTGYDYESWHFRFVGVANAQKIMKSGQCLEEYVAAIKK